MDGGLNYYDEVPHKRARDDLSLTTTMFGGAAQPTAVPGSGLVSGDNWSTRVPWNYPWSARETSRDGYPYSFGAHASSHTAGTPVASMDPTVLQQYNSQYNQSPYTSIPAYSQSASAIDSRISPQLPSYSYSSQSRTYTPTSSQYEENKLNVWTPAYSLSNHTAKPVMSEGKHLFDTTQNVYMANMGFNSHHQSALSSMSPYGQHSLNDFTTLSPLEAQARGVTGLQNFVNEAGFFGSATHHHAYAGTVGMGADPYNPYSNNTYPNMYGPAPPPIPYDPYADVKDVAGTLLTIETQFCAQLQMLRFNEPVMCIYNPLEYAWEPHRNYVEKYCSTRKTVLFLGMNPGPYGMAQTGVPFGEVKLVKDWLGITGLVGKPYNEHPKRPVLGFECTRSEVSGARFWGFLKKYCEKPEVLFKHSYVHNICPLVFMNKTGRNLTPPDLRAAERKPLIEVCHRYLVEVVRLLGCSIIVGVGKFAQREAKAALDEAGIRGIKVDSIMHPSPANPAANRGWEDVVNRELDELDVLQYLGPGPKPKLLEESSECQSKDGAASTASSSANDTIFLNNQGTPSNQSQGTPGTPTAGGELTPKRETTVSSPKKTNGIQQPPTPQIQNNQQQSLQAQSQQNSLSNTQVQDTSSLIQVKPEKSVTSASDANIPCVGKTVSSTTVLSQSVVPSQPPISPSKVSQTTPAASHSQMQSMSQTSVASVASTISTISMQLEASQAHQQPQISITTQHNVAPTIMTPQQVTHMSMSPPTESYSQQREMQVPGDPAPHHIHVNSLQNLNNHVNVLRNNHTNNSHSNYVPAPAVEPSTSQLHQGVSISQHHIIPSPQYHHHYHTSQNDSTAQYGNGVMPYTSHQSNSELSSQYHHTPSDHLEHQQLFTPQNTYNGPQ